jgi:hypothetical protein
VVKRIRVKFYQGGSFFCVKFDEVVDEVEEVARGDGHDSAASLQRPLVGRVQRLVNVDLNKKRKRDKFRNNFFLDFATFRVSIKLLMP